MTKADQIAQAIVDDSAYWLGERPVFACIGEHGIVLRAVSGKMGTMMRYWDGSVRWIFLEGYGPEGLEYRPETG